MNDLRARLLQLLVAGDRSWGCGPPACGGPAPGCGGRVILAGAGVGVRGALQGRGLGSELLRPFLAAVDRSHLPPYLETPNPRTIPFYERAGFEVTGPAQVGDCPPVTFMLRAPR